MLGARQVSLVVLELAVLSFSSLVLVAYASFNYYPGLVEGNQSPIEVVIDKGVVNELIVNCGGSTGIVSHDKVARVYCLPQGGCTHSLQGAVDRLCGQ